MLGSWGTDILKEATWIIKTQSFEKEPEKREWEQKRKAFI